MSIGMIKHTLFNAPEQAKLLAYTSLCRPHLEYSAAVWVGLIPTQYQVYNIKMVENTAIHLVSNVSGRESITNACEALNLGA